MGFGKLTALKLKSLNEPGRHGDGNGLALLVKKSGARSWVLRIQVDGKRRDFGLGSANDVGRSVRPDRMVQDLVGLESLGHRAANMGRREDRFSKQPDFAGSYPRNSRAAKARSEAD